MELNTMHDNIHFASVISPSKTFSVSFYRFGKPVVIVTKAGIKASVPLYPS
jgi:hypothetical protein